MRHFAIRICGILSIILLVNICSTSANDEGFLNATCNEAKDCYIVDQELSLACWSNVKKCKCQNTFKSNFHLKWENNQCLMSKYGPCGEKGVDLVVGCQDGFICVDNQCRDPKDTSARAVKLTPFVFEESICSMNGCRFSDDLHLTCNHFNNRCQCEKVYIADVRSTYWDIRNYDGESNCSVGKFGPCGTKNGIVIECHGNGISCIDGTCLNVGKTNSDVGEDCQSISNCKEGLLCSLDYFCIEPFSLPRGKTCSSNNECRKGLACQRRIGAGPWSFAFCQ